jgi:Arc/MetJ-type ribon-helix-helix transcriptional regulator
MVNRTVTVSTRIDKELSEAMRSVFRGRFLNEADFIRAAIRDAVYKYETAKIRSELAKTKNSVKAVRKLSKLTDGLYQGKEFDDLIKRETKDMP